MDKPNGIEEIIRSCQIDMGYHRYGNLEEKKIKDCCNIDIEKLALAIQEYYLGLLPKEEDMHYTGEQQHDILRDIRNEYGAGRNSAIQEMRDKIKVSQ
jgi:hypothetical protein